jgi:hypothetical protein
MSWRPLLTIALCGCPGQGDYQPYEHIGPAAVAANGSAELVVWTDYMEDAAGDPPTESRVIGQLVVGGATKSAAITISHGLASAVTWDGTQWVVADTATVTRVDAKNTTAISSALPFLPSTGDAATDPSEELAQVECGGTGCLVVFAVKHGGLPAGIAGVRIDHGGTALDAIPFTIADGGLYAPHVGFDGTDYWVTWSGNYDASQLTEQLDGVRVGEDGTILGPPVTIAPALLPDGAGPADPGGVQAAIACTTGACLVVFGGTTQVADPQIEGVRVDSTGAVLDPQPIGIVARSCAVTLRDGPAVAFDGTNYLVGGECGDTNPTYATLVSSAGVVLGPSGTISGAQGQRFASIAGAAGEFFAVWEGSNPTDVRGARISDAGDVLDSDGFAIGTIGESTN